MVLSCATKTTQYEKQNSQEDSQIAVVLPDGAAVALCSDVRVTFKELQDTFALSLHGFGKRVTFHVALRLAGGMPEEAPRVSSGIRDGYSSGQYPRADQAVATLPVAGRGLTVEVGDEVEQDPAFRSMVEDVFQKSDLNGDGKLEWNNDEIVSFCKELFKQSNMDVPAWTQSVWYELYRAIDVDGSYSVDKEEAMILAQTCFKKAGFSPTGQAACSYQCWTPTYGSKRTPSSEQEELRRLHKETLPETAGTIFDEMNAISGDTMIWHNDDIRKFIAQLLERLKQAHASLQIRFASELPFHVWYDVYRKVDFFAKHSIQKAQAVEFAEMCLEALGFRQFSPGDKVVLHSMDAFWGEQFNDMQAQVVAYHKEEHQWIVQLENELELAVSIANIAAAEDLIEVSVQALQILKGNAVKKEDFRKAEKYQEAIDKKKAAERPEKKRSWFVDLSDSDSEGDVTRKDQALNKFRLAWEAAKCQKFSGSSSLVNLIKMELAKLVVPKLFHDHKENKEQLPKSQDLKKEYIFDIHGLTTETKLEVVAISYCWGSQTHPDPHCHYVGILDKLLASFTAGYYDPDDPFKKFTYKGNVKFATRLHEQGLPFGTGGGRRCAIFFDYLSLPQKKRTDKDQILFKKGLKHVNIWYAHELTHTWMLTSLPPVHEERAGYTQSGWPTFERLVSSMISGPGRLLCIDEEAVDNLLKGEWSSRSPEWHHMMQIILDCREERDPPLVPEKFNQVVKGLKFLNEADMDDVIIPRYKEAFENIIVDAENFTYFDLDRDQAKDLLDIVLTRCKAPASRQLKSFSLSWSPEMNLPLEEFTNLGIAFEHFTEIGLMHTGVIGDIGTVAKLKALTKLNMEKAESVSGSIESICDLQHLRNLNLSETKVTGDIGCLAKLKNLFSLRLYNAQVYGDIGGLSTLVYLNELDLGETADVKGDIANLAGLTDLELLELNHTKVRGDISNLKQMQKLTTLSLMRTEVDGNIDCVKHLPKLKSLWIKHTKVSGDFDCLTDSCKLKFYDMSPHNSS